MTKKQRTWFEGFVILVCRNRKQFREWLDEKDDPKKQRRFQHKLEYLGNRIKKSQKHGESLGFTDIQTEEIKKKTIEREKLGHKAKDITKELIKDHRLLPSGPIV